MLTLFKSWSLTRTAWLIMALSGLALEGSALYFQHGMGLHPCVMCIYERVALLGVIFGALIGAIYPASLLVRIAGIVVGAWGAIKGLLLALEHVDLQLNPAPWKQCEFRPDFPQTLPLDQWFPQIFQASGSCSDITWRFLGYTMPQWLVVVFIAYIVIWLFVALSQFKRSYSTRQRRLFKH
ncbi:disulfide bond formation protein DsbB [Gallibacterium salpingitidis]|uniref:disulfide bond formation protein DsbB n=1 Tax=Gallibacterium salpingitidis TaxID=505341 RepID=UPI00266EBA20|nr:disulfide bond formation protein DsbB [Gallibacterium salpingitidis]WKS99068.1 disulfide bond formation protein DsbB [Gallibacterium salpingitidis]